MNNKCKFWVLQQNHPKITAVVHTLHKSNYFISKEQSWSCFPYVLPGFFQNADCSNTSSVPREKQKNFPLRFEILPAISVLSLNSRRLWESMNKTSNRRQQHEKQVRHWYRLTREGISSIFRQKPTAGLDGENRLCFRNMPRTRRPRLNGTSD